MAFQPKGYTEILLTSSNVIFVNHLAMFVCCLCWNILSPLNNDNWTEIYAF